MKIASMVPKKLMPSPQKAYDKAAMSVYRFSQTPHTRNLSKKIAQTLHMVQARQEGKSRGRQLELAEVQPARAELKRVIERARLRLDASTHNQLLAFGNLADASGAWNQSTEQLGHLFDSAIGELGAHSRLHDAYTYLKDPAGAVEALAQHARVSPETAAKIGYAYVDSLKREHTHAVVAPSAITELMRDVKNAGAIARKFAVLGGKKLKRVAVTAPKWALDGLAGAAVWSPALLLGGAATIGMLVGLPASGGASLLLAIPMAGAVFGYRHLRARGEQLARRTKPLPPLPDRQNLTAAQALAAAYRAQA